MPRKPYQMVQTTQLMDWRLPTKEKQLQMYLQKDLIGGFAKNYYWSTSGNDKKEAY